MFNATRLNFIKIVLSCYGTIFSMKHENSFLQDPNSENGSLENGHMMLEGDKEPKQLSNDLNFTERYLL